MSDAPRPLRWETLTKRQFDRIDRARAVVMVTCSPLEVHGPHLPLGADLLEGEGLAERALRFLPEPHRGRPFLKLPFVYAACDGVPQPGTLAFRPSTTIAVLEDLGRSLAAQGFRDVMVSNFHGSPRHFLAIETACDRVSRARGIRMVSVFSMMLSRLNDGGSELGEVLGHLPGVRKADLEGDTHGGLVETAQLLALHPEWVDPDYKGLPRRTVDLWLEERGEAKPRAPRGKLAAVPEMLAAFRAALRFFAEETYSGAPAGASPELGEAILDTLARHTAEAVVELWEGRLPAAQWHSPLWKLRALFVHPAAVRLFDALLGVPNPARG
ncbi:MAG: creatininase family protein [Deltaproteobacteria bacterium]|nr:creatininase family protein [Deltaproteobacteria bacterium]